MAVPLYIPPAVYEGGSRLIPLQHLVLSDLWLNLAFLVGMQWYLRVMIFACLWCVVMLSTFSCADWPFEYLRLWNACSQALLWELVHFINWVTWCVGVLYIWIGVVCQECIFRISSPSRSFPSHLNIFRWVEIFYFDDVQLVEIFILWLVFLCHVFKLCPPQDHEDFPPICLLEAYSFSVHP